MEQTQASFGKSQTATKKVLLIGQLGNILVQIKQALKAYSPDFQTAKNTADAIEEFQRHDYGLVIVDFMMSFEEDGYITVNEMRNLATLCQIETEIIALLPSLRDKDLLERLQAKRVSKIMEKAEGWQAELAKYYASNFA